MGEGREMDTGTHGRIKNKLSCYMAGTLISHVTSVTDKRKVRLLAETKKGSVNWSCAHHHHVKLVGFFLFIYLLHATTLILQTANGSV